MSSTPNSNPNAITSPQIAPNSNATVSVSTQPTPASISDSVLPSSILRGLGDKFYEKRKASALEVEKLVREYLSANDELKFQKVHKVIESLIQDFAYSSAANSRNGGLIGLAATAFALGQEDLRSFMTEIVPPVLTCLNDQDPRVRYYACEAMYNICKVARNEILLYFNEIFDSLSKLSADSELSVKNGADLLDRLIKDIVTEHTQLNSSQSSESGDPLQTNITKFELKTFVPLLSERIYAQNQFARSFLISWLTVLDSVPELELISFLPEFLDGLLGFVSDPNEDVRLNATSLLAEFLKEIREISFQSSGSLPDSLGIESPVVENGSKAFRDISIPFGKLISILLPHTRPLAEERTKQIALSWLAQFVVLAGDVALSCVADLISSVLSCLAHPSSSIRRGAEACDKHLRKLIATRVKDDDDKTVSSNQQSLNYEAAVSALTLLFLNEHEKTRVASLEWLLMLHKKSPKRVISSESGTFPALLKTLSDESDLVVKTDLELLAQISSYSSDEYFTKIISNLLSLFSSDRHLLEVRGTLIVKQLCLHLDSERIFKAFAEILESDADLEFASTMVQTLNLILITAEELENLRTKLKEGHVIFDTLYRSWCHNAVSAFSLCLLAQSYDQAAQMLQIYSEMEMSVSTLIQMDKLVQLLESPVFTYLRLQLLDPHRYQSLYKCLYGLLMLLPQSSAFATLRNRLNSVSSLGYLHLPQSNTTSSSKNKKSLTGNEESSKVEKWLIHFREIQTKHRKRSEIIEIKGIPIQIRKEQQILYLSSSSTATTSTSNEILYKSPTRILDFNENIVIEVDEEIEESFIVLFNDSILSNSLDDFKRIKIEGIVEKFFVGTHSETPEMETSLGIWLIMKDKRIINFKDSKTFELLCPSPTIENCFVLDGGKSLVVNCSFLFTSSGDNNKGFTCDRISGLEDFEFICSKGNYVYCVRKKLGSRLTDLCRICLSSDKKRFRVLDMINIVLDSNNKNHCCCVNENLFCVLDRTKSELNLLNFESNSCQIVRLNDDLSIPEGRIYYNAYSNSIRCGLNEIYSFDDEDDQKILFNANVSYPCTLFSRLLKLISDDLTFPVSNQSSLDELVSKINNYLFDESFKAKCLMFYLKLYYQSDTEDHIPPPRSLDEESSTLIHSYFLIDRYLAGLSVDVKSLVLDFLMKISPRLIDFNLKDFIEADLLKYYCSAFEDVKKNPIFVHQKMDYIDTLPQSHHEIKNEPSILKFDDYELENKKNTVERVIFLPLKRREILDDYEVVGEEEETEGLNDHQEDEVNLSFYSPEANRLEEKMLPEEEDSEPEDDLSQDSPVEEENNASWSLFSPINSIFNFFTPSAASKVYPKMTEVKPQIKRIRSSSEIQRSLVDSSNRLNKKSRSHNVTESRKLEDEFKNSKNEVLKSETDLKISNSTQENETKEQVQNISKVREKSSGSSGSYNLRSRESSANSTPKEVEAPPKRVKRGVKHKDKLETPVRGVSLEFHTGSNRMVTRSMRKELLK